MTTPTKQIAAEKQRDRIPTEWLIEFDSWTNDALATLSADPKVTGRIKVYAGWELEYREAYGIELYYENEGTKQVGEIVKRRQT